MTKRLGGLLFYFALACGGAGDSGFPAFEVEPQGDAEPPTMDELLAEAEVVATASALIPAEGTTLTLSTGLRVTVPAGAIAAGTTLTASQHRFDGVPAGFFQDVYRFETTNQATSPITLSFPIPGFADGSEAESASVIWFHEDDLPLPIEGTVDAMAGTVSIQVTELSSGVVEASDSSIPVMSSADVISTVPYLNQGSSENCWSMSLTMLMKAYGADVEPWDNNRYFDLRAEHGLPFWQFMHTPGIKTHIRSLLPNVEVERKSWWNLDGTSDLRDYLRANMRAGKPTMVHYFSNEQGAESAHMVLFVGIEGDSFVIHDPQLNEAYTRRTWAQITPRFNVTGFDGSGTLAFTTPIPGTAADATLMIPYAARQNEGVSFIRRPMGTFDASSVRVFSWYIASTDGPGIATPQGQTSTLMLDHIASWEVTVANSAITGSPRSFAVGFEIRNEADSLIYTHPETSISLAAARYTDVPLIPFSSATQLSALVGTAGTYRVRFYVSEGGTRLDTAEMTMTVENAPTEPAPTFDGHLCVVFQNTGTETMYMRAATMEAERMWLVGPGQSYGRFIEPMSPSTWFIAHPNMFLSTEFPGVEVVCPLSSAVIDRAKQKDPGASGPGVDFCSSTVANMPRVVFDGAALSCVNW